MNCTVAIPPLFIQIMMSNVLLGCDILPAAAHLTASMLSSAHPAVKYEGSRVFTLPYGLQDDDTIALGSIDLAARHGAAARFGDNSESD